MAWRESSKQSKHDEAVRAAADIYRKKDKYVIINPGREKNGKWAGEYIDVIAKENKKADRAWVIEVETADSVSDSEAKDQWTSYNNSYKENWYLAVPSKAEKEAQKLVNSYDLDNCHVITWEKNPDGTYTYYDLPS